MARYKKKSEVKRLSNNLWPDTRNWKIEKTTVNSHSWTDITKKGQVKRFD